jgi:hypothetical protein
MSAPDADSFVEAFVAALHEQTAAVFAGAGLSIPTGMVDWRTLLKGIARDLGLDVSKEADLVTLAQFHVNERRGRHQLNQALIVEFHRKAKLSPNHELLASLPIQTYWTTNYDSLIEEALSKAGKLADVKRTVQNLATTLPRRDAVVYKMHGDITQPEKAVVTKDDYEAYANSHQLFSTALQGDLVSKTFLFIGFSFSDPNLSYILARIRLLLGENRREHYCLLRRVQRADFPKASDYQYAKARQELQVNDLRRYGIIGILVDGYQEYTELLRRIKKRFQTSRIFLSGSSIDYAPLGGVDGPKLVNDLARSLILSGSGIVSGFGSGIGPLVVNGALEAGEKEGAGGLHDRLILRPFPIAIADAALRRKRWTAYRRDMIGTAGIAIFLFGEKAESGRRAIAEGVIEEFEIAHELGLTVIPVGATGSAAKLLHDRVLRDFDSYYPHKGYRKLFEALAKPGTSKQTLDRVMELVKKLQLDQRVIA